jgi:O-acetyl-ADP-ribose deacetylase (regulator of RNase III)
MKISLFLGDICDVKADALCTSTNPRLSLVMGTGASIRGRGGYQILRACEGIVETELLRSGRRDLPAGSAHLTTAGNLPSKAVVHCVASDASHRSSPDIVRSCVRNALARAAEAGCKSIAMPLFATGHARFAFDQALQVMAETLRDEPTTIKHVFIVVRDPDRSEEALRLIRSVIPEAAVDVRRGPQRTDEEPTMWSVDWSERHEL